MNFYEQVLGVATSQDWMSVGMNLILSTIVGGIVLMVLLFIVGKVTKQTLKYQNAFLLVLIMGLIGAFGGVLGFFSLISFIPMSGLLVTLVIWILLTKVFFSELSLPHALIVGVVGYGLYTFLVPAITNMFIGFV